MDPPIKKLTVRYSHPARRNTVKAPVDEEISSFTDAQLKEEFSLMLTVNKENERMNLIRFNLKKREFRPVTMFDYSVVLIEGSIDYRDSLQPASAEQSEKAGGTEDEEEVQEKKVVPEGVPEKKLVRNSFNFSNRGTQTIDFHPRHQLMQTEPPETVTVSGNSSQGIIFDAYINKKEKKVIESERSLTAIIIPPCVNRLASITERMIIQNLYEHLLEDFKYYDDPADELRGNIGCLLPLWRFASEITKFLSVTCVCFNPQYSDLFAISFGSFSFTKQAEGAILLYSLKNTSYPVFTFLTDCSVMTLDINHNNSNYICAGFYDGSVATYNLARQKNGPERRSKRGVHHMYISQVQWDKKGVIENEVSFYSISPDGQIVKWTFVKNGLKHHVLITLGMSDKMEKSLIPFGNGLTFDFHTSQNHLYIVGTQMGQIHICLMNHSTEPLQTFAAHNLSVYRVAWNSFHPGIFITCSEDWTVKIWEQEGKNRKPLFAFDLGSPVYNVQWAPFSSTVFAAVTASGEVFIYDLAIDKQQPLCQQVVCMLKNTRAMYMVFNWQHPVILVGDDRGEVNCLKLSPNLRKMPKKGLESTDKKAREEFEVSKLNDILASVRQKF